MIGVLVILFYLNRKKKLGKLGFIITRQIENITKSRKAKVAFYIHIFMLYAFGNFIFGVEAALPEIKQIINEQLEQRGITNTETLIENAKNERVSVLHAVFGLLLLVIPNPISFSFFSTINDLTDGWALHWATVFLIESMEYISIFVYFRYIKN